MNEMYLPSAAPASSIRPPFLLPFAAAPVAARPARQADEEELLSLIALTKVDKVGPVTARNLIAHLGSAREVFRALPGRLTQVPDVGHGIASRIRQSNSFAAAEAELAFCQREGIRVLHFRHPEYPISLRELFDAPLVLYVKGSLPLHTRPAIAIVGSRRPTERGSRLSAHFAQAFAQAGINVVSGLAYGIDYHAHEAALRTGGLTTAVLGHGLDRIYPHHHRRLAQDILAGGGAWVTEFGMGTNPDACNFPARNRIISGLCLGVLVVEAGVTGGALITARFAFDHNREVYAIPGDVDQPMSVGCNQIIRDNVARLVTRPEDVLEDLSAHLGSYTLTAQQPQESRLVLLTTEERRILSALANQDLDPGDMVVHTGLSFAEVSTLLLALEMKGQVKQVAGRKYRRV